MTTPPKLKNRRNEKISKAKEEGDVALSQDAKSFIMLFGNVVCRLAAVAADDEMVLPVIAEIYRKSRFYPDRSPSPAAADVKYGSGNV